MLHDCPFCHHDKGRVYSKDRLLRAGGTRDIRRCERCGLLYPSERMDEKESLDYVKELYKDGRKLVDPSSVIKGIGSRWWLPNGSFVNLGYLVKRHVKAGSGTLDIGALSGAFCYLLQSMGFDAYGLEPFEACAAFARGKGLKVYAGSFPGDIPAELTGRKFSLISMLEMIYYLTDLKAGLEKARDILEDRGYLLVKCHQITSKYYYKDGKSSPFIRCGDNMQFMPEMVSLASALRKTGFETVDMYGTLTASASPAAGRLFRTSSAVLNKLTESFFLNVTEADQLIVLARKKA